MLLVKTLRQMVGGINAKLPLILLRLFFLLPKGQICTYSLFRANMSGPGCFLNANVQLAGFSM